MNNIWWIGGSPGAGKTTVSTMLGDLYGIYVYHCDEHYKDHIAKSDGTRYPMINKLAPLSEEDFWMRPVKVQYEEAIEFYMEEFEIMLENLSCICDDDEPVIVDGAIVMPQLIASLGVPISKSVWLIPTEEFQRKQHLTRGKWVYETLNQCSRPEKALENWMLRDIMFAEYVKRQCEVYGLPCFITDGMLNMTELFNKVKNYFAQSGISKKENRKKI